jgi:hypothetical protein
MRDNRKADGDAELIFKGAIQKIICEVLASERACPDGAVR